MQFKDLATKREVTVDSSRRCRTECRGLLVGVINYWRCKGDRLLVWEFDARVLQLIQHDSWVRRGAPLPPGVSVPRFPAPPAVNNRIGGNLDAFTILRINKRTCDVLS
jgi:hypothetical protein